MRTRASCSTCPTSSATRRPSCPTRSASRSARSCSAPRSSRPALVYGSGTLAFAAIGLLRHLYPGLEIWAATRPGFRSSLAGKLGADAVLSSEPDTPRARGLASGPARRPSGPGAARNGCQDGPGVVYDTIGSTETVETSLRLLRTGGTLVVSGVEPPKRFEWTPMYFKELTVIGSNGFGIEEVAGVAQARLRALLRLRPGRLGPDCGRDPPLPLGPLATRRCSTLADSRHTGAVKVLLQP